MSRRTANATTARDEALALTQVAGLLKRGVPADRSLAAVGRHLPAGSTREQLTAAAAGVAGGVGVGAALQVAFPHHAPLLQGSDELLPTRLRSVGEHMAGLFRLRRQVEALAFYPFVVALGALMTPAAVGIALWARGQLAPLLTGGQTNPWPWIWGAGAAAVVVAVLGLIPRLRVQIAAAIGGWVGGERSLTHVAGWAEFLSTYARLRAVGPGGPGPALALQAAACALPAQIQARLGQVTGATLDELEAQLLQTKLPAAVVLTLLFGERSGQPSAAASQHAQQLTRESSLAAERNAGSLTGVLLILAGVAVGTALVLVGKVTFVAGSLL